MMNDVATAETPNTLLEPAGAGLGETKGIATADKCAAIAVTYPVSVLLAHGSGCWVLL